MRGGLPVLRCLCRGGDPLDADLASYDDQIARR